MSRETKFRCDQCEKPVGDLYGPICLSIEIPQAPFAFGVDFCSIDCAVKWMKTKLPQKLL